MFYTGKNKWDSLEKKFLTREPDAVSGATLKSFQFTSLEELERNNTKGKN